MKRHSTRAGDDGSNLDEQDRHRVLQNFHTVAGHLARMGQSQRFPAWYWSCSLLVFIR
jgi:hypothetical protein